jgi:hypothetical protein
MATATKPKRKEKDHSALQTTLRGGLKKSQLKSNSFLDDLRDAAKKNGKAVDELGFGDILKQLEAEGEIVSAAALGTGWAILNNKDKARLAGVPMLILNYQFNEGDNGEFVSVEVLTNTERLIVNDGSTGIYRQLKELAESGELRAIYCKHGLRESKYEYEDPKTGEKKPASTFYIDTSA